MDQRIEMRLLGYWEQCQRLREEERRSLQGINALAARKAAPAAATERPRTGSAQGLPQLVDLRD